MADIDNHSQEVFDQLYKLSLENKVSFLELFIFALTVSARAIWSDEQSSDKEKVEAFKWLNELNHRIWNIRFYLKNGIDDDSVTRLYSNLKFYGEQSALLQTHLMPSLSSAFMQLQKIGDAR